MFWIPIAFSAWTVTPAFEMRCAPVATEASVWKNTTSTPMEAATLAPPLSSEEPPLPARPHTINWFIFPSVLTASIVIPSPETTAS